MRNFFLTFEFLKLKEYYKHRILDQKTLNVCYRYEIENKELELRIVIPRTKGKEVKYLLMKNDNPKEDFDWEPTNVQPKLDQLPKWFREYVFEAKKKYQEYKLIQK